MKRMFDQFFPDEYMESTYSIPFEKLYQEVPYSVAVDVEVWDEEDDRVLIHAAIYVAKPSHKAMVIGRAGEGIKAIGTAARKEIRDLVDKKVHLELWVKVRED